METIFILPTSSIHWALLTVLLITLGVQVYYYSFYTLFIKKQEKSQHNKVEDPISLIICTKNEGEYLRENLSYFLEQDYSNYELIIVNNGSTDDTETILTNYQLQYSNLRTTRIPLDEKFHHNKKLALTIGIKAAKYDRLVFSNIQSRPCSIKWLSELSKTWTKGVHLGYSNFKNKKGFAYNFRKFDILLKSITSMSFAVKNKAHSGNGNNLGYKKSDFFANKGFATQSHFESGYDHLMVYQLARKDGASACLTPQSKITLPEKKSKYLWKEINEQYYKSRKLIPKRIKLLIDLEPLSKVTFYLTLIFAAFFSDLYFLLGIAFFMRSLMIGRFFKIATTHLKEENLFLSSYLYDFFVPYARLYFMCTNFIFSKRNQWK